MNVPDLETVYSQYDSEVMGNTVKGIREKVAVVQVPNSKKQISIYTDCYPQQSYNNPKQGVKFCIEDIYNKLIDVGSKPLAITNCLNFGNPENPEIMWEFQQTIQGMQEICESLDLPVVSGNVSFYNETNGENIMPTPVIGAIGLIGK